jgi:methyl-accepting chemotaxis protein
MRRIPEMMSKFRLGFRISASFSLLILLLLIVSFIFYIETRSTTNTLKDIKDVQLVSLSDFENISLNALGQTAGVRAYLLYGTDASYQEFVQLASENAQIEKQLLDTLTQNNADNRYSAIITELKKLQEYDQAYNSLVEQKLYPLMKAGNKDAALQLAVNEITPIAKGLTDSADTVINSAENIINQELTTSIETAQRRGTEVILITIAALIIAVLVSLFLTRSIIKPVNLLISGANTIAGGDLTTPLTISSRDEIGEVAQAFNKMRTELSDMIKSILDIAQSIGIGNEELSAASEEMAASSDDIAQAIEELAKGATRQAETSEHVNNLIDLMANNTEAISDNAETVKDSSMEADSLAKTGMSQAEFSVEKIKEISAISEQTTLVINELGDQSRQIGEIIDVIKGIADQTNLLALNAAIEAARAGEQGRGFAVVAEEVRKLAELSSESTQQIADVIANMQNKTKLAVDSMDKSSKAVANGVEAVMEAGTAFTNINEAIQKIVGEATAAINALKELSVSARNAAQEMQDIAAISEESAASTEEISATTEEQSATMQSIAYSVQELAQKGLQLQSLMSRFKI